jgi:hypothetical protein
LQRPRGVALLSEFLSQPGVLADPGRCRSALEGVSTNQVSNLTQSLAALGAKVESKLETLTNSPGEYRDELQKLQDKIKQIGKQLESRI